MKVRVIEGTVKYGGKRYPKGSTFNYNVDVLADKYKRVLKPLPQKVEDPKKKSTKN